MDATLGQQQVARADATARAAGWLCPEYREVVDRTVELLLNTKARDRKSVV